MSLMRIYGLSTREEYDYPRIRYSEKQEYETLRSLSYSIVRQQLRELYYSNITQQCAVVDTLFDFCILDQHSR